MWDFKSGSLIRTEEVQHCGLGGNSSQTLVLNLIPFVDKRTLSPRKEN